MGLLLKEKKQIKLLSTAWPEGMKTKQEYMKVILKLTPPWERRKMAAWGRSLTYKSETP